MFFATTLCMPDSVRSRCGPLRSAPHRSPHAIAALQYWEDVPSDASRDLRCDVLTFVRFSACGEMASDQYCSAIVRGFERMHCGLTKTKSISSSFKRRMQGAGGAHGLQVPMVKN